MTGWELLTAVVVGLAVNESIELSPWLARRVVKVAARLRYAHNPRAVLRGEEWAAIIEERPGKLFKLLTASGFLLVGILGFVVRMSGYISTLILALRSAKMLVRGGIEYTRSQGDQGAITDAKNTISRGILLAMRPAVRTGSFSTQERAMEFFVNHLPPEDDLESSLELDAWRCSLGKGPKFSRKWKSVSVLTLIVLAFFDLFVLTTFFGFSLIRGKVSSPRMIRVFRRLQKRILRVWN